MERQPLPHGAGPALLIAAAVTVSGCGDSSGPTFSPERTELSCSIPVDDVLSGQRKDGIPALTDPDLLFETSLGAPYPEPDDRVVGVAIGDEALAVPLRLFWYHEIVNVELAGIPIAITHCPLTGSSLVFDRTSVDGAAFGVSGLLYQNNLIMYDRSGGSEESLWPQMSRGARCGDRDGQALPMVPATEMSWGGWLALHPTSTVVSEETGWGFDYRVYPYGNYDEPDNAQLLFRLPNPIDRRRPPKERAFGFVDGDGGVVFPFGELARLRDGVAERAIVYESTSDTDFVLFWSDRSQGGAAYAPEIDGEPLDFYLDGNSIRDEQTGSYWNLAGHSTFGSYEGRTLDPIGDSFVAFWFSWPAFYPDVRIWRAP